MHFPTSNVRIIATPLILLLFYFPSGGISLQPLIQEKYYCIKKWSVRVLIPSQKSEWKNIYVGVTTKLPCLYLRGVTWDCLTCVNICDMDTGYNDHLPEQNRLREHGLSTNLANWRCTQYILGNISCACCRAIQANTLFYHKHAKLSY